MFKGGRCTHDSAYASHTSLLQHCCFFRPTLHVLYMRDAKQVIGSAANPPLCARGTYRLGQQYEAELPAIKPYQDTFNASFKSPVTAARSGHFLHLAHAVGTDKVTVHGEFVVAAPTSGRVQINWSRTPGGRIGLMRSKCLQQLAQRRSIPHTKRRLLKAQGKAVGCPCGC